MMSAQLLDKLEVTAYASSWGGQFAASSAAREYIENRQSQRPNSNMSALLLDKPEVTALAYNWGGQFEYIENKQSCLN